MYISPLPAQQGYKVGQAFWCKVQTAGQRCLKVHVSVHLANVFVIPAVLASFGKFANNLSQNTAVYIYHSILLGVS